MARRAVLRRAFGYITTDTEFDQEWVDAIKAVIPLNSREWDASSRMWFFAAEYHEAIKTICEWFFGAVTDVTGGIKDDQKDDWRPRWEAYKDKMRFGSEQQKQKRERQQPSYRQRIDARSVLHVTGDAPSEVIRAAYRALAAKHHPDKGGDTKKMAEINAAYEELQERGLV